jgi:hypothetical protein
MIPSQAQGAVFFGSKMYSMTSTITPLPLSGHLPQGGEKANTMPNDLIHRKPKNKTQATQPSLTNTSPSPFWGKLEGGS